MLHAVGTSFGAFFTLRFLLGTWSTSWRYLRRSNYPFVRNVRILCRTKSNSHHLNVLQEERAGERTGPFLS